MRISCDIRWQPTDEPIDQRYVGTFDDVKAGIEGVNKAEEVGVILFSIVFYDILIICITYAIPTTALGFVVWGTDMVRCVFFRRRKQRKRRHKA